MAVIVAATGGYTFQAPLMCPFRGIEYVQYYQRVDQDKPLKSASVPDSGRARQDQRGAGLSGYGIWIRISVGHPSGCYPSRTVQRRDVVQSTYSLEC